MLVTEDLPRHGVRRGLRLDQATLNFSYKEGFVY